MKGKEQKPLDLYDAVYEIVRMIPSGRVSSYGAIAEAVGMRSGARLVGYLMSKSHFMEPKVPAHRVVNSAGLLSGKFHFSSLNQMQDLLEKEGVKVKNDKVVHFKQLHWHPKHELI